MLVLLDRKCNGVLRLGSFILKLTTTGWPECVVDGGGVLGGTMPAAGVRLIGRQ